MENLKELAQKYLELGKEIEALKNQVTEKEKFEYPIYFKFKNCSLVVKFTGLQSGEVVVNSKHYNIGDKSTTFRSHTDSDVWQQLNVCEKTGFFDGQLVWCWDNDDTHVRTLRFYDVKNKCTYQFDGTEDGHDYDNYEKFEGNYPDWAKNLLQ